MITLTLALILVLADPAPPAKVGAAPNSSTLASALQDSTPALSPESYIDLRSLAVRLGLSSVRAIDFDVVEGRLYFLLADTEKPSRARIAVFSRTGTLLSWMHLPDDSEYLSIAVARDGSVWVGRARGRQGEVALINRTGAVLRSEPTDGVPHALLLDAASQPSAWVSARGIRLPYGVSAPVPASPALLMATLGASVILIDKRSGEGWSVTPNCAQPSHFVISGPLVDDLRKRNAPPADGTGTAHTTGLHLVNSAAGFTSSHSLALLAPVSVDKGAIVVSFRVTGASDAAFACRPPRTLPQGAFNPYRIRTSSDTFFLMTADGVVALYKP